MKINTCMVSVGLAVAMFSSCATPVPDLEADRPATFNVDDEAGIHRVMAEQEAAWDRGDIPGFMQGYTDEVCFINSKGRTCGKAGVTANYHKSYPDKAAMGDLSFGDLEVIGAGAEHAWCTGTWELIRAQDTIGGGFSLLWAKDSTGWRILRDQTY